MGKCKGKLDTKSLFHWLYLESSKSKRLELLNYMEAGYTTVYYWFRFPDRIKAPNRKAAAAFFENVYGINFETDFDRKMSRKEFATKYLELCSEYRASKKAS